MVVLDANILVRAVLGRRVRGLIAQYGGKVEFFAPDAVFDEASRVLPEVLEKRKIPTEPALEYLTALIEVVQAVGPDTYGAFESNARQRLTRRDEDDWPVLAVALALGCHLD